MKKNFFWIFLLVVFFIPLFADADDDLFGGSSDINLSDADLFGGADESFGGFGTDDDFFFDDDDMFVTEPVSESEKKSTSDLKHGILFQTGSVKIGGTFDLSLTTLTSFQKEKKAKDSFKETMLLPTANAELTIDARPFQNLRLYGKGGVEYPYLTKNNSTLIAALQNPMNDLMGALRPGSTPTFSNESFQHLFYIKELFSDFNFGDYFSFRFGKQTVTWGVGYFFSPADVINLSQIDPENPTMQVEGPLALRSQIVFPGTQNAIWAYIIPDNDFNISSNGIGVYARDTAFALKGDIVLGSWELGLGGYYKYNHSPRMMLTASGTLFGKVSVFAEGVLAVGQDSQWTKKEDKDIVLQGTLGASYFWKNPKITLAAQYFYNGNNEDFLDVNKKFTKQGNNIALSANFGKVFTNDFSINLYGILYTKGEVLIASTMFTYSPFSFFSISAGPYISWLDFDTNPIVSAKITVKLGSGKF